MKRARGSGTVIGIDGLGYMGLATALGFAVKGHRVVGFDIKPEVRDTLRSGRTPYHEAGFPELVKKFVREGRLQVVQTLEKLVQASHGTFLCLPTPQGPDGRIDLRPIQEGTTALGHALRSSRKYHVVVVKSTVVPGTTSNVIEPLLREASGKGVDQLGVAANPEFLAEGSAIRDATQPERIVIGISDPKAARWLRRVYAPFSAPVLELPPSGAELVKYASNTFLAIKVSFANEMSRLAERLGVHIDPVMGAVGADSRIGPKFLRAGPGFGGSCFEKDVRALLVRAQELGIPTRLGAAALETNQEQVQHVVEMVRGIAGPLDHTRIAVLGLAFKAGTDDVRESRAFPILEGLLREHAEVRAHDPAALPNFRREWERLEANRPSVIWCRTVEQALRGSDLAVLQADWPEYLAWKAAWTRLMRRAVVLDLRRTLKAGVRRRTGLAVHYLGVGTTTSP